MLEPTPLAGHPTWFCGTPPEQLELAQRGIARWNKRSLSWCWIERLPGLTIQKQNEAAAWVFDQWRVATNGYFTFSQAASGNDADCILLSRNIDGRNRTLAEMQLPPGDNRPLRGWFDIGERWDVDVLLKLVLLHEVGHFMGLGHLNPSGPAAVLKPVYDPTLRTLQPADVAAVLGIYPDAAQLPPVSPSPPPTAPPSPPVGPGPEAPADGSLMAATLVTALGTFQGNLKRVF